MAHLATIQDVDGLIPRVACYFTPSYESIARGLRESAEKFGVTVHAIPVPDTGNYVQNVLHKTRFICDQLAALPEGSGLLFLDADARFVNHPDWSEFENTDFAVHILPTGWPVSCTNFLRNTSECRGFLDKWFSQIDQSDPRPYLDEYILKSLLDTHPPKRLKTDIPRWSFCKLNDGRVPDADTIVIQEMIGTNNRLQRWR